MRLLQSFAVMAGAAFVFCASAKAQYVQGQVDLTYDSSDQTVQVFAETDCDTGIADSYQMWLMVDVFAHDSSGNSALVSHNRWTAINGDSMITTPDGLSIDAYPGITYTATATHGFYFTITDPALGVAYFDDPYGFSAMSLLDNNGPTMRVSPEIPYLYYVVLGVTFAGGKALARTHTQLPPTPPADLNITQDIGGNTYWIVQAGQNIVSGSCPGVDVATSSKNANGTQLPCAFFGSAGDAGQTPQVPAIKAWYTNLNANIALTWGADLAYSEPGSHGCSRFGSWVTDAYSDSITGSRVSLQSSQKFDLTSALGLTGPGMVQGGVITLTYSVQVPWGQLVVPIGLPSTAQAFKVGLWGTDPSVDAIKSSIASSSGRTGYTAPWWAQRYFQEETAYHQFNYAQGLSGTPNFGPKCGFGISQMDPPGIYGQTAAAAIQDVWNWQANMDDGIRLMREKIEAGNRLWDATLKAYSRDMTANKPLPPCNVSIGLGFVFAVSPTPGQHSFSEANGIKCMGQCTYGYLNYNHAEGWFWSTFTYQGTSQINVVNRVLSQSVQ